LSPWFWEAVNPSGQRAFYKHQGWPIPEAAMLVRAMLVALAVLVVVAAQPTSAQETPGFSLQLYADLPAADPSAPGDPFAVRAGTEIHYRIEATVPSPAPDVEYYFETPPGSVFVSADVGEGATIDIEEGARGNAVVFAMPTEPFSRIEVTVRVNDTYQGPVSATARFRGRGPGDIGPGSSNVVTFQFDHGDGVPGQLMADAFVDMNGNAVFENDDVRSRCPVYVYDDLTDFLVPDDVTSPTDARLPLASIGEVTFEEPARINLFAGRYSVFLGACDTPLPPSGAPQTTFELIDRPPVTRISDESGSASYEVQTIDMASTQITELVRAEQPVGASATPVDLRFEGARLLRWTDRAEGETGYRIEVTGTATGTFELPPDSTEFTLPEEFIRCSFNELHVAVSAVSRGAAGYPARTDLTLITDCFVLPVTPPGTGFGTSAARTGVPARAFAVVIAGLLLAGAGIALRKGCRGVSPEPAQHR
jgi:hypothetical protein